MSLAHQVKIAVTGELFSDSRLTLRLSELSAHF